VATAMVALIATIAAIAVFVILANMTMLPSVLCWRLCHDLTWELFGDASVMNIT
jgi:hypothetical protein